MRPSRRSGTKPSACQNASLPAAALQVIVAEPGLGARALANTARLAELAAGLGLHAKPTGAAVLAIIIGTLAVANTMLAAVLERRRELALLSTIGWSGPQLGWLVLGEAIAVSMIGTGFGLALGTLFSGALPPALALGNFITPDQTAWGLGRACLIGVATGVLGAVYPIWRVTRTSSAHALAPG